MWLLRCCNWLPGYFNVSVRVVVRKGWLVVASLLLGCVRGCQGDGMQFLRYCGWLPVCCDAVARML